MPAFWNPRRVEVVARSEHRPGVIETLGGSALTAAGILGGALAVGVTLPVMVHLATVIGFVVLAAAVVYAWWRLRRRHRRAQQMMMPPAQWPQLPPRGGQPPALGQGDQRPVIVVMTPEQIAQAQRDGRW